MTSLAARVSLAIAVQERTDGPFPSMQTYPVSFERYLTPGDGQYQIEKVHGMVGVVTAAGVEVDVPGLGFTKVKMVLLENISPSNECGEQAVSIEDAPVIGTVGCGQIIMATCDARGWAPDVYRLTGNVGAEFRLLILGN